MRKCLWFRQNRVKEIMPRKAKSTSSKRSALVGGGLFSRWSKGRYVTASLVILGVVGLGVLAVSMSHADQTSAGFCSNMGNGNCLDGINTFGNVNGRVFVYGYINCYLSGCNDQSPEVVSRIGYN